VTPPPPPSVPWDDAEAVRRIGRLMVHEIVNNARTPADAVSEIIDLFSRLAAADERERCVRLVEEQPGLPPGCRDALVHAIRGGS
jgi:hypothetical protein